MEKLNKYKKSLKIVLNIILIQCFILSSTFAVKIVNNDNGNNPAVQETANEGIRAVIITFLTMGTLSMAIIFFMLLFAWILMKIWNKLTEVKRGRHDYLFNYFSNVVSQSHTNYDAKLKKRNWKFLWLFWKRKPIFTENKNGELDIIGEYHGETYKKEGFYALTIYNKVGLFKYIWQVILIPNEIKDKVLKKIDVEKGRTMILRCEGLDSINSHDYCFMPLLIDPNNMNKFIDFSDKIRTEFIEKIIHKDIIEENLLGYRKGIINSIETNPYVHFGRRGGENFKK